MNTGAIFNQDSGVQAAGDAYLTIASQTVFNGGGPQYRDLQLTELETVKALAPEPAAGELVARLHDAHLIVIQAIEIDGRSIARQVAAKLHARLREETGAVYTIRDWTPGSGPIDLNSLLAGRGAKILLLVGASRNNFIDGLDRIARALGEGNHFGIVATDDGPERWQITKEDKYWNELDWKSYYGEQFLAKLVKVQVEARRVCAEAAASTAPSGSPPSGTKSDLLTDEEARTVGKLLREPERILDLAKVMAWKWPLSGQGIVALATAESGDRHDAVSWYRNQDERLQLLAIGLILLQGLPADQAFAGVETIMEKVWRRGRPNMDSFDYVDIEGLSRYFKRFGEGSGDDGTIKVTAGSELLGVAWELHRRRILEALPAVADMFRNAGSFLDLVDEREPGSAQSARSMGGGTSPAAGGSIQSELAPQGAPGVVQTPSNSALGGAERAAPAGHSSEAGDIRVLSLSAQGRARQLYGTVGRLAGLRRAAVASLSQVGQLSDCGFAAVQPYLHELAAEDAKQVRVVVAQTLAAARGWGLKGAPEDRLFRLLHEWWRDSCLVDPPTNRVSAEKTRRRSTVALAVGHASMFDLPGQMNESLVSLLQTMVADPWPVVRQALQEVLPWMVATHLHQLDSTGWVRGAVAGQKDLTVAAAAGIAAAYRLRPAETAGLLTAWKALALGDPQAAAEAGVADREMLLALVARALGALHTDDLDAFFPPQRIIAELVEVLGVSRGDLLRRHVLIAAGEQALRHYERAAPLVVRLLSEVSVEDRSLLVDIFVRGHLDQRQALGPGEETLQIEDRAFPIWISRPRPSTAVEVALFHWFQEWDQAVAQQVAAETLAVLALTELERRERALIAARRGSALIRPAGAALAHRPPVETVRRLSLLAQLSLWLAVRGRELRGALAAPFGELIWLSQRPWTLASGAEPIEQILQRWRGDPDNESLEDLVKHLRKALSAYRRRWPLLLATLTFVAVLIKVVAQHA